MDLVLLAVALLIILLGAELFTNGIEWFGHKLGLAEGAVGSVLAAVGTALPETMIPLIAILFGGAGSSDEVGIGAILGAPFMLATLAMFVTGRPCSAPERPGDRARRSTSGARPRPRHALLRDRLRPRGRRGVRAGRPRLAALARGGRPPVDLRRATSRALPGRGRRRRPDLAPLRLAPPRRRGPGPTRPPRLRIVGFQVVLALACIIGGAYLFVGAVTDLAHSLGVDEALLALIIAPIATELPEKFNSVLWVRQGKDTLAMGNITGAMVFQSAIPTSVALVFASSGWASRAARCSPSPRPGSPSSSSAVIFIPLARRGSLTGRLLLGGGVFYLVYLGLVVGQLAGSSGTADARGARGRRRPLVYSAGARRAAPRPSCCDRSGAGDHADRQEVVRPICADAAPASAPVAIDDLTCYFEGGFVPMRDARVSIMTHAFMYGTAVVRGHPRLLERRPGAALRPEGPRARRAHPAQRRGCS